MVYLEEKTLSGNLTAHSGELVAENPCRKWTFVKLLYMAFGQGIHRSLILLAFLFHSFIHSKLMSACRVLYNKIEGGRGSR